MILELNVNDSKAKTFLSFLKELDFVKVKVKTNEEFQALTDADIIFGNGKIASDEQLKTYLIESDSEETLELKMVCEDVINYLDKKNK